MKITLALSILIILFIIVYIVLAIQLHKKVERDRETERKNKELKKEYQRLQDSVGQQKREFTELESKTEYLKSQKAQLYTELNELNEIVNKTKESNEQIANDAYCNYATLLEQSYKETEATFDSNMRSLKRDITNLNQELDKLKATRAAAHEALLKEQEVKENKDNYKLSPSQGDLADARRLELVKRELNKPRILSMLIWQTYWQPLAKKQFPLILQDKTKCGIYKITNQLTDESYIGQSVDVYKRWCEHCKCGLGIDTPPGNKLYKAIQDYGLENFTFELLVECPQSELNEKENYFIELYQADTFGYNGNKGVTK